MKSILIIEDDYYIRDIYQRTFTKGGYTVDIAADGQQGLDKSQKTKFDLILLDIMLPHVTGIDVLRSIRTSGAINHETPVYLITNLGQEDIIKEAFTIGADGYLIKSQLRPQEILHEIDVFFEQVQQPAAAPATPPVDLTAPVTVVAPATPPPPAPVEPPKQ